MLLGLGLGLGEWKRFCSCAVFPDALKWFRSLPHDDESGLTRARGLITPIALASAFVDDVDGLSELVT